MSSSSDPLADLDALWTPIQRLCSQCRSARTLEELHAITGQFCTLVGFDIFVFRIFLVGSIAHRRGLLLYNYPRSWYHAYHENRYFAVDPMLQYCRTNITPIAIRKLDPPDGGSGDLRRFISDARDVGMFGGITFPIHGALGEWGFFGLFRRTEAADPTQSVTAAGHLFTSFLHEASRRLVFDQDVVFTAQDFSRREKECLLWAAEGKTAWETSRILGITETTVVFHLQKAMKKLNASNRTQAATRVLTRLMTDPEVVNANIAFGNAPPHWELAISVS
jgi:DNA-binding CsgD family transcriptional regulator